MPNPRERTDDPASPDLDVAELVNGIVLEAARSRASDIHIEPWSDHLLVRIRVDGALREVAHLPLDWMDRLSGRLKVMANLVSYQTAIPQEGNIPASAESEGVELRLSIFPTVHGEKIVIRLFDPRSRSFDLGSLGFDLPCLRGLVDLITRPSGLVLLTGPTGSGKTSTIYAALQHLVERHGSAISISTVEDPVEFHLPGISQTQVNPARELTYPIAVRSLLRQDPQVVMIGEIRDDETARIAIQAGLTGHLVISTLHAGSTSAVFARLAHMDIEPFLLASSISGVLGIRLIRSNCRSCLEPYQPQPALLRLLRPEDAGSASFRRGAGCPACHATGFDGRVAVAELLIVDDSIREAVLAKQSARTIHELARANGMLPLLAAGLARVARGETTLEELSRVISLVAT